MYFLCLMDRYFVVVLRPCLQVMMSQSDQSRARDCCQRKITNLISHPGPHQFLTKSVRNEISHQWALFCTSFSSYLQKSLSSSMLSQGCSWFSVITYDSMAPPVCPCLAQFKKNESCSLVLCCVFVSLLWSNYYQEKGGICVCLFADFRPSSKVSSTM